MASEPEVTEIHHEIDETRADLAKKVEKLEEAVRETVLSATEGVGETIETVKSTVQETVDTVQQTVQQTVHSVQQTFDLNYQMQRRPWLLIGGSVVAGFVVGALVSRRSAPSWGHYGPPGGYSPSSDFQAAAPERFTAAQPERFAPQPEGPREPGMVENLMTQFRPELDKVKEMAVGYLLGAARDWIKDALPSLRSQIDDVMNSATTKLGGEPVRGPVLGEGTSDSGSRMYS
jgi:ElaB/YqjD/DUF883 family membrane-anchored ribosome-binding protein